MLPMIKTDLPLLINSTAALQAIAKRYDIEEDVVFGEQSYVTVPTINIMAVSSETNASVQIGAEYPTGIWVKESTAISASLLLGKLDVLIENNCLLSADLLIVEECYRLAYSKVDEDDSQIEEHTMDFPSLDAITTDLVL